MPTGLQQALAMILPRIQDQAARHGRSLIAIAGPPAAGKSTLAAAVVDALNASRTGPPTAALLPMDGFHYDNGLLSVWGLLERKGAPETFDAIGFFHLLKRLKEGTEDVAHPVFDRSRDLAIAGAGVIAREVDIVVVEGNYLLLNTPPWSLGQRYYDLTIFVDLPQAELERRLIERWRMHGETAERALEKAHNNDLPNAQAVLDGSVAADIRLGAD
jgi:pantothenate kinase